MPPNSAATASSSDYPIIQPLNTAPSAFAPGLLSTPELWYAFRTAEGSFGLAKASQLPQTTVARSPISTAGTLADLVATAPMRLWTALHAVGITPPAVTALGQEFDNSNVGGTSIIQANPATPSEIATGITRPTVQSGSGDPAHTGSEAVGTSLVPGTSGIVNSLSGLSIPSPFAVFGNMSFWKGIGLVLAGALILVFAALELRKL
jgi:hypothetical protein